MHEDTYSESSLPTIVYQLDGCFVVGFTLEFGSSNSINVPQIVLFSSFWKREPFEFRNSDSECWRNNKPSQVGDNRQVSQK